MALLDVEEQHVVQQGFGAGVIVISFAPELLRHGDGHERILAESAIIGAIERQLGWTDRTAMIAPGRFGVISVPVTNALALAARAREIHGELSSLDLEVDVAYALRRDRGGLAAAAARADAALDTAVARRRSTVSR